MCEWNELEIRKLIQAIRANRHIWSWMTYFTKTSKDVTDFVKRLSTDFNKTEEDISIFIEETWFRLKSEISPYFLNISKGKSDKLVSEWKYIRHFHFIVGDILLACQVYSLLLEIIDNYPIVFSTNVNSHVLCLKAAAWEKIVIDINKKMGKKINDNSLKLLYSKFDGFMMKKPYVVKTNDVFSLDWYPHILHWLKFTPECIDLSDVAEEPHISNEVDNDLATRNSLQTPIEVHDNDGSDTSMEVKDNDAAKHDQLDTSIEVHDHDVIKHDELDTSIEINDDDATKQGPLNTSKHGNNVSKYNRLDISMNSNSNEMDSDVEMEKAPDENSDVDIAENYPKVASDFDLFKNLHQNLRELEKNHLLLGIEDGNDELGKRLTEDELSRILLLSLLSKPSVLDKRGKVLTNHPESIQIWEDAVKQFSTLGYNVTHQDLIDRWTKMLSSTRKKLILYRKFPNDKKYQLSSLDLEITCSFSELVNAKSLYLENLIAESVYIDESSGHSRSSHIDGFCSENEPDKFIDDCEIVEPTNNPSLHRSKRLDNTNNTDHRKNSKEINVINTSSNIKATDKLVNIDLSKEDSDEDIATHKTIDASENGSNSKTSESNYETVHNTETFTVEVSQMSSDEDEIPLAFIVRRKNKEMIDNLNKQSEAIIAEADEKRQALLLDKIKQFRQKNKYGLHLKSALHNLPKNHWMNWWKKEVKPDPTVKLVANPPINPKKKKRKWKRRYINHEALNEDDDEEDDDEDDDDDDVEIKVVPVSLPAKENVREEDLAVKNLNLLY